MPRERVTYDETVRGHAVFTYRNWFPALSSEALFWSLLGGLAAGVAASLSAAVLGWVAITPAAGGVAVRHVLVGVSGVGALLFYLGVYWRAARGKALVVEFEAPAQCILIQGLQVGRKRRRFPLGDVGAFRLVETQVGWRTVCSMVMDTSSHGSVTLLVAPQHCHSVRDDVPRFVAQLNARLEAMQASARDTVFQSGLVAAALDDAPEWADDYSVEEWGNDSN